MNILVTGCNGQLGTEMRIQSAEHAAHVYFFTDVAELDITDRSAVHSFVLEHSIDLIVNCAAYTNVDKAECDEATARLLNANAVENLGSSGAKVIHISTDYVFRGEGCVPCKESDPVDPCTAYGRTKLEGERLLRAVCPDAIILRTAWLYSAYGNNFVKTMLRLSQERESLGVVFDQVGSPTYAADLAKAIYTVSASPEWKPGIYHFTNEGVCSWYDFTHEILSQSLSLAADGRVRLSAEAKANMGHCVLRPILSTEYSYPTPRPHYSVLDKSKFKQSFGVSIPYWTDGLRRCLCQLLQ